MKNSMKNRKGMTKEEKNKRNRAKRERKNLTPNEKTELRAKRVRTRNVHVAGIS